VDEVKFSSPHTVYDIRRQESWGAKCFRKWNQTYVWFYRGMLLAAMAAGFFGLTARRSHPLLYIPTLLVGINILFVTYLIMPYGRYIQVFDVVFLLQALLIFSTMRKARGAAAAGIDAASGADRATPLAA
jgi:hypothetical protein